MLAWSKSLPALRFFFFSFLIATLSGAWGKMVSFEFLITSFIKILFKRKIFQHFAVFFQQVLLWMLKAHFRIGFCKQSNMHLWNSFLLIIFNIQEKFPPTVRQKHTAQGHGPGLSKLVFKKMQISVSNADGAFQYAEVWLSEGGYSLFTEKLKSVHPGRL